MGEVICVFYIYLSSFNNGLRAKCYFFSLFVIVNIFIGLINITVVSYRAYQQIIYTVGYFDLRFMTAG